MIIKRKAIDFFGNSQGDWEGDLREDGVGGWKKDGCRRKAADRKRIEKSTARCLSKGGAKNVSFSDSDCLYRFVERT